MANIKVKLGPNANFFYDMGSGLKVLKGKEVELNMVQQNLPRVRKALQSGLLVKSDVKGENDKAQELLAKYSSLIARKQPAGMKELSSSFTLDELKMIATKLDIELEPEDDSNSIIEAVNTVLSGK